MVTSSVSTCRVLTRSTQPFPTRWDSLGYNTFHTPSSYYDGSTSTMQQFFVALGRSLLFFFKRSPQHTREGVGTKEYMKEFCAVAHRYHHRSRAIPHYYPQPTHQGSFDRAELIFLHTSNMLHYELVIARHLACH